LISLLDPDDIPESLLNRQDLNRLKLEDYPRNTSDYHEAKRLLLSQSLIRQDNKAQKLSIHSIVQDTIEAAMDEEKLINSVSTAVFLFRSAGFSRSSTVFELLLPSFFKFQHKVRQLVTLPGSFVVYIELYQLCSEVSTYVPFCVDFSKHLLNFNSYLLDKGTVEGLGPLQELISVMEEQLQTNNLTRTNSVLGDRIPISDLRDKSIEELGLGVIEYEQKQHDEGETRHKRRSQNPKKISSEEDAEEQSSDAEPPASVSEIEDDFSSTRSDKSSILPFSTIKRRLDLAVWWTHLLISLGIVELPLAKSRQRLRWRCVSCVAPSIVHY
jgi:hypothetical protein